MCDNNSTATPNKPESLWPTERVQVKYSTVSDAEIGNPETVKDDLIAAAHQENPSPPETPAAGFISQFNSEEEASKWGVSSVCSDPTFSRWLTVAENELEEHSPTKKRLLDRQAELERRIREEPPEVCVPVHQYDPEDPRIAPLRWKKAPSYVAIGVAGGASVAATVLGVEFLLESIAAETSHWAFAQTEWGARALVFSASFGTFLAITGWSATEKYPVHWSVRLIGRIGALLGVAATGVTSFALGSVHVEEGQWLDWPMLMIPFGAGVLICGAFLAKEFAIWVSKMAFPKQRIRNKERITLDQELEQVNRLLGTVLKRESNAKRLIKRVEDIAEEFAHRVAALWHQAKKYDTTLASTRERRTEQVLAEARAKIADLELQDLEQPI